MYLVYEVFGFYSSVDKVPFSFQIQYVLDCSWTWLVLMISLQYLYYQPIIPYRVNVITLFRQVKTEYIKKALRFGLVLIKVRSRSLYICLYLSSSRGQTLVDNVLSSSVFKHFEWFLYSPLIVVFKLIWNQLVLVGGLCALWLC